MKPGVATVLAVSGSDAQVSFKSRMGRRRSRSATNKDQAMSRNADRFVDHQALSRWGSRKHRDQPGARRHHRPAGS